MVNNIKGLSEEEVKLSREKHGDNSLNSERKKSFFVRFLENLGDPIIRILLFALILQVIFTFRNINYIEIGGIIVAILISTLVSTISEYRSEKAFEKLRDGVVGSRVKVIRADSLCEIDQCDVVVGDIICLGAGEKICADGEIISGRITVDQSALNGESVECIKIPGAKGGWELTNDSKAYRGSVIIEGSAIMRVGRVGLETFYGMVARDVQADTRVSPLKLRLTKLAKQISRVGYMASALVGIVYLFNSIIVDNGFDNYRIIQFLSNVPLFISTLIKAITLMITMVVVTAPEGLPMMITVVLSANMKRMVKDNVLVKKLVGIETAGSMNMLFTDKTGTLTIGRPQCDLFIYSFGKSRGLYDLRKTGEVYNVLVESAKLNTDATLVEKEITGGNATDRAIYEFFLDCQCKDYKIKNNESWIEIIKALEEAN